MTAPVDNRGWHDKFIVKRTDGRHRKGQKHEHCRYFVLDLDHDSSALAALLAYADDCQVSRPQLSADLRRLVKMVMVRAMPPTEEVP